MFTIISTIIGFLGATLPKLLDLWQDKKDKAHELELLDKQIEFAKLKISTDLEAVGMQTASLAELATINAQSNEIVTMYNTQKTGITFVDAINGMVRPILAIFFMVAYFLAMYPHILMALNIASQQQSFANNMEYLKALQIAISGIWTENDDCFFAGIIAFYFGSRFMENYKRG
jgi:hypothetical protein